MTMLTTGLISSLQVFLSLSVIICIVESDQVHVKIRKREVPLRGFFFREKTRTLVECVYSCIQHTDCRSLGYNKTSAVCQLYPSYTDKTQNNFGTLLYGNLREVPSVKDKKTPNQTTQTATRHRRRIVLRRGKMTWRKASQSCGIGVLLRIRNEADQATAVNILKDSGLEYVAIGAFRYHLKWETNGGYGKLLYSDWAEGEPDLMDFFVGLSKRSGYKWEGLSFFEKVDGRVCGEY